MILLPLASYTTCIQPRDIGVRKESSIISAQQKWVDSGITVSRSARIMRIDVLPDKVNFCTGQLNKSFIIKPGRNVYKLPFALQAGDKINFSVVGSKVCKNKTDGKERYIDVDKRCSDGEEERFGRILNQQECKEGVCPNKYIRSSNARWLNGKASWGSDIKEVDVSRRAIEQISRRLDENGINSCSVLSESEVKEIDTYVLNFMCENICRVPDQESCVTTESFIPDSNDSVEQIVNARQYENIGRLIGGETYIPLLRVHMYGENFHNGGGMRTNYNYSVNRAHSKDEELTFILGDDTSYGYGGYNIIMSVTRMVDPNRSLYINITTDDSVPQHSPGHNNDVSVFVNHGFGSTRDTSMDVNNVMALQRLNAQIDGLGTRVAKIYYGITDHGCDYQNTGEFDISLTVRKRPKEIVSTIYEFFDRKVKKAFFQLETADAETAIISRNSPIRTIYTRFVSESSTTNIRSTIIASLTLFIILYTLCYFLGLSSISIYEFLMICVRVGIITQLLGDDSWDFFYNKIFSFFIYAPKELMNAINLYDTSLYNGPQGIFKVFDQPFDRFLSWQSWQLMLSLIFSGPLGIVVFCLIVWGMVIIVRSLFSALFSCVTYIVMIALLLSLAPIFIICLLFKYTRQMFMSWVGGMATFAIHPVILMIAISLIVQAMDYIVYSVFSFEACTECIFEVNILGLVKPCILHAYVAQHAPDVASIMAFIILAHAMGAIVEASFTISQSLFSRSSMPVSVEPGQQFKKSLQGLVGLDVQYGGQVSTNDIVTRRPVQQQNQR